MKYIEPPSQHRKPKPRPQPSTVNKTPRGKSFYAGTFVFLIILFIVLRILGVR
jgi:hypothetical protein